MGVLIASKTDMYPTIPELGSLPYDLQKLEQRLIDAFAWAESRNLTEASRAVYEAEGARIRNLVVECQSVINRINGGTPAKTDSIKRVKELLSAIGSGIDGLNAIIGNGTAIDYAKNLMEEGKEVVTDTYDKVKEEVTDTADKLISGNAPWLILILGLVLAIIIFARKI